MRGIFKRSYSDVYNAAYRSKNGPRGLANFVVSMLRDFEAAPMSNARVPQYLRTMLDTQSIAQNLIQPVHVSPQSLALSRFIEKRAARQIVRHALHHLYKPNGWFQRRTALEYAPSAPSRV